MAETNRIEYKAELTRDLDLEKEVIAFLEIARKISGQRFIEMGLKENQFNLLPATEINSSNLHNSLNPTSTA